MTPFGTRLSAPEKTRSTVALQAVPPAAGGESSKTVPLSPVPPIVAEPNRLPRASIARRPDGPEPSLFEKPRSSVIVPAVWPVAGELSLNTVPAPFKCTLSQMRGSESFLVLFPKKTACLTLRTIQ